MREIQILTLFYAVWPLLTCQGYQPFFFREEEVRHVRDVQNAAPKLPCKEDTLVEYLAECQVTNPESIIGIAIADFDSTCRTVGTNVRKIDKFLKNCTLSPSLYTNLVNGLKTFDEKLCKNAEFYKKYDEYDKCIQDLDKDYDACDGPADWNEDEDKQKICKTFKKIVDCYYIKTTKVCGYGAANTLKELMVEVINCVLPIKCSVGSNPSIKNAMPENYVQSINKNMAESVKENQNQVLILNFCITAMIYILLY